MSWSLGAYNSRLRLGDWQVGGDDMRPHIEFAYSAHFALHGVTPYWQNKCHLHCFIIYERLVI